MNEQQDLFFGNSPSIFGFLNEQQDLFYGKSSSICAKLVLKRCKRRNTWTQLRKDAIEMFAKDSSMVKI